MKESARKTYMSVLIGVVIILALVVIPKLRDKQEASQDPVVSVSVTAESSDADELVLLSESSEGQKEEPEPEQQSEPEPEQQSEPKQPETVDYKFRNQKLLDSHYEKHGIEMGFESAAAYEAAASAVVNNPEALHKTEKEDGDDVYYLEDTNEFVIVSKDGYIRTYFNPNDGIKYFNRQ